MRSLIVLIALLVAQQAPRPPADPNAKRAADLVELVKLDPTIKLDIRYAGTNNFLGKPVYKEARAFLQRPAAEAPPEGEGPAATLVAALPRRQREVVVLRVFTELSVAETAEVLGIPEGTVKSNFAKAIAALRGRLAREENA